MIRRQENLCFANQIRPSLHTERDSRKDEAVVFIFIFATAGLLGWAAVKPWVGKWVEVRFVNPFLYFLLSSEVGIRQCEEKTLITL